MATSRWPTLPTKVGPVCGCQWGCRMCGGVRLCLRLRCIPESQGLFAGSLVQQPWLGRGLRWRLANLIGWWTEVCLSVCLTAGDCVSSNNWNNNDPDCQINIHQATCSFFKGDWSLQCVCQVETEVGFPPLETPLSACLLGGTVGRLCGNSRRSCSHRSSDGGCQRARLDPTNADAWNGRRRALLQ